MHGQKNIKLFYNNLQPILHLPLSFHSNLLGSAYLVSLHTWRQTFILW